jgi:hypothetical protein
MAPYKPKVTPSRRHTRSVVACVMPFAMGFVVVWPQAAHAAPAAAISGVPRAMFDWDRDHCPGRRGVFETGGGCANDVQTGCDPDVTDAPVKAFSESCFSVLLFGTRSLKRPSGAHGRLYSARRLHSIRRIPTCMFRTLDSAGCESACIALVINITRDG